MQHSEESMSDKPILDSGKRHDFQTGSQRDIQPGKGRPDLLPFMAIMRVSKIYEGGAIKYSERNWELGQPLSQYLTSGLRHLFKWIMNWQDEDHLAQALWNFMCLVETQMRIEIGMLPEELNDIPSGFFKKFPNMADLMERWFKK
jgi:hypothetical protein